MQKHVQASLSTTRKVYKITNTLTYFLAVFKT